MKKYVVRRARGTHTVFTFPPIPNVKGSGWAWSPTPPGGVTARPSWHAPRAVLVHTATYGARVGVPLVAADRVAAFREEAVERVRVELRVGAAGAVDRYHGGYAKDGDHGDGDGMGGPACLVCVVGEPLTVVGFNEDARLGALPRDWTDTKVTAEHGGMLQTYHVAYIGDDYDYIPGVGEMLLVHRGSEEADVRRTLEEGGMRLVSLTHAPGRVGFDAVCEVGFHTYGEVPLELANVEPVKAFPFEEGGETSVWDGVEFSPFRWVDGKRECDAEAVRAWLSSQFPDESGFALDHTKTGRFDDGAHMVWVGLEILPDPNVPTDATVSERVTAALEYRRRCGGERHARMVPVVEKLRGMGVPMRVSETSHGRIEALFLVDDLDADPFFPVTR